MKIELAPIGFVKTDAEKVPRHWTVSDVEGAIVVRSYDPCISCSVHLVVLEGNKTGKPPLWSPR